MYCVELDCMIVLGMMMRGNDMLKMELIDVVRNKLNISYQFWV